MTQCNAKAKTTGQTCKGQAVTGRTKCRMHGGATPVGPASASWKHGRDSKYLPGHMLEDYKASSDNANILALTSDIALVDTRIVDLLKQVDRGQPGKLWGDLVAARRAYTAAQRIPDKQERGAAMVAAAGAMCDLIDRGAADWGAWDGIFSLVERRRKLVDTERKRLVEAQTLMHRDKVLALMGLLVEAVTDRVHDADIRSAIVDDFIRISSGTGTG